MILPPSIVIPDLLSSALKAELLFLLGIATFVTVVLGTGIYVVSGRWAAARPARDAKAFARREKAQRTGFLRFALRGPVPFFICFFFARSFFHAWQHTGRLELPIAELLDRGFFATAVGFAAAGVEWFVIKNRAEEAHDRAARLQDERHS